MGPTASRVAELPQVESDPDTAPELSHEEDEEEEEGAEHPEVPVEDESEVSAAEASAAEASDSRSEASAAEASDSRSEASAAEASDSRSEASVAEASDSESEALPDETDAKGEELVAEDTDDGGVELRGGRRVLGRVQPAIAEPRPRRAMESSDSDAVANGQTSTMADGQTGTMANGRTENGAEEPAVLDKPREERSYKEFFPDLDVHMPLSVRFRGPRTPSAPATPLSPPSSMSSRTPSSLSIKLVFSDPSDSASRPGKSPLSYAGTPQSSVVVLAPKRPVVALPATRFRELGTSTRGLYRQAGFRRPPGHYIRNVELTEKDLAARVEYDLEDMDREWLGRVNSERTAQGASEVSPKQLESIMDHIEKEWFDLVKEAQKAISAQQQEQLPAEESACAICGSEECDNTNAIVFCDGCNLAVHQDCYGVPYIPEGQWLCRRCMLSPDKDVSCVLCPQRGGAFKKTTANKWAHLLCALWIPEVGIANTVYMEPIDSVDQIPRSRWRLDCHLCHRRQGACIQCCNRQCTVAFHPTCARRAHLSMAVRPDRRSGEPVFRVYCERHTPSGHAQDIDLAAPMRSLARAATSRRKTLCPRLLDSDASVPTPTPTPADAPVSQWPPPAPALLSAPPPDLAELFTRKDASLQLTMRIFNPARPVLNEYVYKRVVESVPAQRLGQHARAHLVARVARYWALKRSERHGAPLLKRLHLEPWTASATQQRAREMAEDQQHAFARRLRTDLERLRLLTECVRRREREKLRRARAQTDYLMRIIAPLRLVLMPVIDELLGRDSRGVLSRPVTAAEAPDYERLIPNPMDLGTIRQKVDRSEYLGIDQFTADLRLVLTNCMTYNRPNTYYYQLAARLGKHVDRLVSEAQVKLDRLPIDSSTGCLQVDLDPEIFTLNLKVPQMPAILAEDENGGDEEAATGGEGAEGEDSKPEMLSTPAPKEQPSVVHVPTTRSQSKQEPHEDGSADPTEDDSADPTEGDSMPQTPTPQPQKAVHGSPRVTRSARRATTSQPAARRLTLFEQLSVPPPDVRQSMRTRFAYFHPEATEATIPGSDIPDDVNVLKSRLRRASTALTPRKRRPEPIAEPAAKRQSATPTARHGIIPTALRLGEDPSKYPHGTLVWAKMESFPWFPAETCDPQSEDVPDTVRESSDRSAECATLVRFVSASAGQWRWVSPRQVCRLGVDPAVDRDFYRARKARSNGMVKNVRTAYADACASHNITPLAP